MKKLFTIALLFLFTLTVSSCTQKEKEIIYEEKQIIKNYDYTVETSQTSNKFNVFITPKRNIKEININFKVKNRNEVILQNENKGMEDLKAKVTYTFSFNVQIDFWESLYTIYYYYDIIGTKIIEKDDSSYPGTGKK